MEWVNHQKRFRWECSSKWVFDHIKNHIEGVFSSEYSIPLDKKWKSELMKRDTYEINCHCQGGTLTNVNELSACKLPNRMFFMWFLYFRDANLQCFSRKSIDTFPAIWILSSRYTDNSSLPEDERKMQKLWAAKRSGKSNQKKSRWNFSIK